MPDSFHSPDFSLVKHKLDPTLLSTAITFSAYRWSRDQRWVSRTYALTLHQDPVLLEQGVFGKSQKLNAVALHMKWDVVSLLRYLLPCLIPNTALFDSKQHTQINVSLNYWQVTVSKCIWKCILTDSAAKTTISSLASMQNSSRSLFFDKQLILTCKDH